VTAGTILVVMCVWVALAAWRDWPGPLDVLRRVSPVRRHDAGRRGVTVPASRPREIEGRVVRPDMGPCPGCGAADDQWCKADCQMIDPKDYR